MTKVLVSTKDAPHLTHLESVITPLRFKYSGLDYNLDDSAKPIKAEVKGHIRYLYTASSRITYSMYFEANITLDDNFPKCNIKLSLKSTSQNINNNINRFINNNYQPQSHLQNLNEWFEEIVEPLLNKLGDHLINNKTFIDNAMERQFKNSYTINSIQDLIAVLQDIDKQESNKEMWFRGQINSDWFLEPNVMRNKIPINSRCSHVIKGPCIPNNDYLLPNCYYHEYLEKLKEYANKANFSTKNDLEVLAFVQHYKGITPLLDWSEDPLVALYFATTETLSKDKCPSQSASIYVVDPLEINNYVGYRSIPNSKDISETFVYKLINDRSFQWLCFKTPKIGYRICRQSGNFIFQNPQMGLMDNYNDLLTNNVYEIKIPYKSIDNIKQELTVLRITQESIYGHEPNFDKECSEIAKIQKTEAQNAYLPIKLLLSNNSKGS